MLLLMCQDTVFSALDARRRYFPVAFAVSCFLAASALWQVNATLIFVDLLVLFTC